MKAGGREVTAGFTSAASGQRMVAQTMTILQQQQGLAFQIAGFQLVLAGKWVVLVAGEQELV